MDFLHSLSTRQIDSLRAMFRGATERLDMEKFVFGAAASLGMGTPASADADSISKLMELFSRADRDGLGAITWSDFNTVFVAGDPADVQAAKQSHSEGFELIVREAASKELLRAMPSGQRHAHTIRHFTPLPLWAVLFTDSPTVVLFRSVWKPGSLEPKQLRLVAVMQADAPVLDVWYHGTAQAIVLTASNFALEVWDAKALLLTLESMDTNIAELTAGSGVWKTATAASATDVPLLTMTPAVHRAHYQHCFVPEFRMCHVLEASKLITTSSGGQVHVWHLHISRPDGKLAVLLAFRGELLLHKGPVKQMALLANVGVVATAGIDGVVALWAIRGLADGRGGRRGVMDRSEGSDAMAALLGRTFAAGAGGPTSAETDAGAGVSARAAKELAPVSGVSLHATLRPHSRAVTCLLYLGSSKLLVSGSHDASITVTDMLPKEDGGYKAYKLMGHRASIVALERLDSVKQSHVGVVEIDIMDSGASSGLAAEPMGGTSYKASQFVSMDSSFELRWWNASRNAETEGVGRCIQVLGLSPYNLVRPSAHAMALLNVRMSSYDPEVAANPLAFASDAASSLLVNAAMVGSSAGGSPSPDAGPGGAGGDDGASRMRPGSTAAPTSDNAQLPVFVAFGSQPRVVEARAFADRKIHVQNLVHHSSSSRLLLFATGEVLTYDVHTGELLTVAKPLREETTPGAVAWVGGDRRIAVGCRSGQVHVIDPHSVAVMRTLQRHSGGEVVGVGSFDRDSLIVSMDEAGDVLVHDEAGHMRMERSDEGLLQPGTTRAARALVRRLRRANGRAVVHRRLAVAAPALMFATADANGGIRVWDATAFSLVAELSGHDVEVTGLVWGSNARTLVSCDRRGVFNAWSVTRGDAGTCLATWCLAAGRTVLLSLPWAEDGAEADMQTSDPVLRAQRLNRRRSDHVLEEMWRANTGASAASPTPSRAGGGSRAVTPPHASRASRDRHGSTAGSISGPIPRRRSGEVDSAAEVGAVSHGARPLATVSRRDTIHVRAREHAMDDAFPIRESGLHVEHVDFAPSPPLPSLLDPSARAVEPPHLLLSVDVDGTMSLLDLSPWCGGPVQAASYLPLIMHRRCRVDGGSACAMPLENDARVLVTADTSLSFDDGTEEDALWLMGDDEGDDHGWRGCGGRDERMPATPSPRTVLAGREVRVVHHMHGSSLPALGAAYRGTLPPLAGSPHRRKSMSAAVSTMLSTATPTWARSQDDWGEGAAVVVARSPDCAAVFCAAPDKMLHSFRLWPKGVDPTGVAAGTSSGEGAGPVGPTTGFLPYGCIVTVAGKVPDAGGMGVAAGGGSRRVLEQNHWIDPIDNVLRSAVLLAGARALARVSLAKAGGVRPPALIVSTRRSPRRTSTAADEVSPTSGADGSPREGRRTSLRMTGRHLSTLTTGRPDAISTKPVHPLLRALARHAAMEFGEDDPGGGTPVPFGSARTASGDGLTPIVRATVSHDDVVPLMSARVQAAVRPMTAAGKDALYARLTTSPPRLATSTALSPERPLSPSASPRAPAVAALRRAHVTGDRLSRMLGAFDRVGVIGGEHDPVWGEAGVGAATAFSAADGGGAAPTRARLSLAGLLLARNPRLFNRLRRIYELKSRGVQYRSMDDAEIHQRAVGVYEQRQEEQRRRAAMEDERNEEKLARTLTLGLIAQLVQTAAPADGEAGASGGAGPGGATDDTTVTGSTIGSEPTARADSKPAIPQLASGFHLVGSAHAAAAAKMASAAPKTILGRVAWESMEPEKYLEASQATRIGSERRRDVESFAHLCRFADPEKTGRIQWSLLVEELNKADSSLAFLRWQMEALFRNADVHGGGVLSVHDFARALFPRADPATIKDVVGYAYYSGPNLEQVRQRFLHHNATALKTLRDIFDMIDTDHSGTVDAGELDAVMRGVMAGQQRVAAAVSAGTSSAAILTARSGGAAAGATSSTDTTGTATSGAGGGAAAGGSDDKAGGSASGGAGGEEGDEFSFTRTIGLDPTAEVSFEQFVTLVGPHVIDT